MVDLQLGPGAVLRGPLYVVEHSEGVSGLKSHGMKTSVIYFFTGQYDRKKNEFCSADPWVFSSRLELAVVCHIIFRSKHTVTTFLLAFKNKKIYGFGEKLYPFQLLTTVELYQ